MANRVNRKTMESWIADFGLESRPYPQHDADDGNADSRRAHEAASPQTGTPGFVQRAGHLFGHAGRHGDVINALTRGSAQLKSVGLQYRRLHITRVRSDYRYSAEVARQEAERALDDANWVASRLTSIPEREFKSLPLAPSRQR